jgi:hypothetical protein
MSANQKMWDSNRLQWVQWNEETDDWIDCSAPVRNEPVKSAPVEVVEKQGGVSLATIKEKFRTEDEFGIPEYYFTLQYGDGSYHDVDVDVGVYHNHKVGDIVKVTDNTSFFGFFGNFLVQ